MVRAFRRHNRYQAKPSVLRVGADTSSCHFRTVVRSGYNRRRLWTAHPAPIARSLPVKGPSVTSVNLRVNGKAVTISTDLERPWLVGFARILELTEMK